MNKIVIFLVVCYMPIMWAQDEKYFGVLMRPLTLSAAEKNGITPDEGVLIDEIFDDSCAETFGIQKGDVIICVNSKKICRMKDFNSEINTINDGDEIIVQIIRNGSGYFLFGVFFSTKPPNTLEQNIDTEAEEVYRKWAMRQYSKKN